MNTPPGATILIGGDPPMNIFDWRNKFFQTNLLAHLMHTSLRLPLELALREGHMYCLWPLVHILLVCTTKYTISVYYFSMCVYY